MSVRMLIYEMKIHRPVNISRRRSRQNIRGGEMQEMKSTTIYYDEKEVCVYNPFSDEKVVLVESWDDKEKVL